MYDSSTATLDRPRLDANGDPTLPAVATSRSLTDLALDELEDELRTFAADINAATAQWLDLVAEFCRREAHTAWGLASPAHWLAWQCSLSAGVAREHVRVALAVQELPVTHAHFAAGRISFSKVRAITRLADPDNERSLVRLALNGSAAQVERVVREWTKVIRRDDPDRIAVGHERRGVTERINEHGNGVITIEVAPEETKRAMAAIDALLDEVVDEPGPFDDDGLDTDASAETRNAPPRRATLTQRRADAFLLLVDEHTGASNGADRIQATIDVDLSVLAMDAEGTCFVRNGPVLAAETARRLTCDAELEVVTRRSEGTGAAGDSPSPDASCGCGAAAGQPGDDLTDDADPDGLMEADFISGSSAAALAKTIPEPTPVPEESRGHAHHPPCRPPRRRPPRQGVLSVPRLHRLHVHRNPPHRALGLRR